MTGSEVYNSIFIVREKNNRLELQTDKIEEFSFAELKEEVEEILSISDFTPSHLQPETVVPRIIQAYKKLNSGKSSADGYLKLLMG